MAGIDDSIPFAPVNIAVLTVSDSRTEETDKSGALLVDRLISAGHTLAEKSIVKDDRAAIVAKLRQWIDDPSVEVVLATGGTGDVLTGVIAALLRCRLRRSGVLCPCRLRRSGVLCPHRLRRSGVLPAQRRRR